MLRTIGLFVSSLLMLVGTACNRTLPGTEEMERPQGQFVLESSDDDEDQDSVKHDDVWSKTTDRSDDPDDNTAGRAEDAAGQPNADERPNAERPRGGGRGGRGGQDGGPQQQAATIAALEAAGITWMISAQQGPIVAVELRGDQIDADSLQLIKPLPELAFIALESPHLNDEHLAELSDFSYLQVLEISGSQFSTSGLVHLKPIVTLEILELRQCAIDPDRLAPLETLGGLKILELVEMDVQDQDLPSLYGLTNLRQVNLIQTQVTPQGLAALQKALPDVIISTEEE